MTRKRKKENKISANLFSGLFFLAGLGILVMIGISLGKETYRKRQIQKEIEGLQADIQKMNQENSELSNLISYLSTSEFQEKEAREKLNLQKENEQMIVLKKDLEPAQASPEDVREIYPATEENTKPNWKKWLTYFFSKKE